MSKIEKALNRAREERGTLLVPVPNTGAARTPGTGTAMVAETGQKIPQCRNFPVDGTHGSPIQYVSSN